MVAERIAEEWYVPLREKKLTLREALNGMSEFKLDQTDVPLIIQLIENPKYNMLGIFPGRTSIQAHDCIHVLLGRGVLVKDEAFVIGFTMGTTKRLTNIQKNIFKFVSRFIYPYGYRFGPDELNIFEVGLRSASDMMCPDFSKLDFTQYIDYTIDDSRRRLGIDVSRLMVDYSIEKNRYTSPESQRLL